MEKCVPEMRYFPKWTFDPYEYAGFADNPMDEAYTKKTCLWGRFDVPKPNALPPVLGTDKIWNPKIDGKKLGWHTPEAKKIRNLTPQGFARAFVAANSVR